MHTHIASSIFEFAFIAARDCLPRPLDGYFIAGEISAHSEDARVKKLRTMQGSERELHVRCLSAERERLSASLLYTYTLHTLSLSVQRHKCGL